KIRYLKFENAIAFVDSMQFASTSLANLVDNHKASNLPFICLEQGFPTNTDLLTQKGFFPYSFITSQEAYNHPELPHKRHFTNDLTGIEISDQDYRKAQEIFNTFECNNLGDYSMIYLKTDVLLLADCMSGIRAEI